MPYAGQKRGPKDRYTLDRGWVSTNHFGLAHRCGEEGQKMHKPLQLTTCVTGAARNDETRWWTDCRKGGEKLVKRIRGLTEDVCPKPDMRVREPGQVRAFIKRLAFVLGTDKDLRKAMSYGGMVWHGAEKMEALLLGGKLTEGTCQKRLITWPQEDGSVMEGSIARIGWDRGNAIYAQWARMNVKEETAGDPDDEKAGDYVEAVLSLA